MADINSSFDAGLMPGGNPNIRDPATRNVAAMQSAMRAAPERSKSELGRDFANIGSTDLSNIFPERVSSEIIVGLDNPFSPNGRGQFISFSLSRFAGAGEDGMPEVY